MGTAELRAEVARLEAENRELRRQIETDALTGLLTRKAFKEKMDARIRSLGGVDNYNKIQSPSDNRESFPMVSLLLIDADNFKSVNDTYGHPAGDIVLQAIADVLKRNARESDLAGRWSGDEFAVGFNNAGGVAKEKAEAICREIAEEVKEKVKAKGVDVPKDWKMTVSIGVAETTGPRDVGKLYQRADEALYNSKHQGRNRVVVAGKIEEGIAQAA